MRMSLLPGQTVAAIMHLAQVTAREDHELGLLLHCSDPGTIAAGSRTT